MAKIFLPIVFLSLLLTACAAVQLPSSTMAPLTGQVLTVQPSTVIYGIRSALQGVSGTTILQSGENYLVVWSYSGQNCAGFFAVHSSGQVLDAGALLKAGGNLANSKTVSDLVAALKANGWSAVAPGAAPAILAELAGSRLISAPVILLAVGAFGPEGFEGWMEDTFYPKQEEL